MARKNPENKPLRIVRDSQQKVAGYGEMLAQLAIAESNLARAGKDSAMPHFIAIVKELEKLYGFRFEQIPENEDG